MGHTSITCSEVITKGVIYDTKQRKSVANAVCILNDLIPTSWCCIKATKQAYNIIWIRRHSKRGVF